MATRKAKTKALAPKKKAVAVERAPRASVAVKTLGLLPPLSDELRTGFRAAFTDEQCVAWGERTKATNVLSEAEKWVVTMARALKDDTDVAYSRRRLSYLCELVVKLHEEIQATTDSSMRELRRAQQVAMATAEQVRRDLARRLRALAGGQQTLLDDIAQAALQVSPSPLEVEKALTATIALATKVRQQSTLTAVAQDVGLTEDNIQRATEALHALSAARVQALNANSFHGDAPSVSRLEGRILREMKLAQRLFREAREEGVSVPALVAGPSLKVIFRPEASGGTAAT